jgi:hypothetical protein
VLTVKRAGWGVEVRDERPSMTYVNFLEHNEST